jgi:lipoprotein-anchoring transpeptidase ErfK/SrfK
LIDAPKRAGGLAARSLCAVLALAGAASATAAPAHSAVPRSQNLAALLSAHQAYSQPARGSLRVRMIQARRPLTGERTVLPVLGRRLSAGGATWLHVRLPGRPNGRAGWIAQRGTAARTTPWRIVADTSSRRVTVYRSGRPVRTMKAVVGRRSTPTPHGEFFVEEVIQLRASDVGAPFALALSARSSVLQEFDGGPGQIGIHGRANVGGVLGTATSHGCIRLDDGAMRWLVLRIAPGTPVTIAR